MTKEPTDLARYLSELKRAGGFSLGQLSDALQKLGVAGKGTSRQYLSSLINGRIKDPSPEVLADLAVALSTLSMKFENDTFWQRSNSPPRDMKDLVGDRQAAYENFVSEIQRKRFQKRLKEYKLSPELIDMALRTSDDQTIAKVMNGEEPLELSLKPMATEIARHRDEGLESLTLRVDPAHSLSKSEKKPNQISVAQHLTGVQETHAPYGDTGRRHVSAGSGGLRKLPQRVLCGTRQRKLFAAGRARIEVIGLTTGEQDSLLEALVKVVDQLLKDEEKG